MKNLFPPGNNAESICISLLKEKSFWMKVGITILLLSVFGLQFLIANSGYSQSLKDEYVNLEVKDIPLIEVFQQIEKQTDFRFAYTISQVKDYLVTLDSGKRNLEEALELLLKGIPLRYEVVRDKFIVLSSEKKIKRFPVLERLKPKTSASIILKRLELNVSGIITNQAGEPLIGVNVLVKGTGKGTATDFEGKFELKDVNESAVLSISYIGYQAQEIPLNGRSELAITLLEDSQTLDEVVVVGYGAQKKANLTGAVGVAGADRLENRTITSIGQGLQGVVPGLNITYGSGDPNEGADFNIRGFESINGGSPLILVDGVPMDAEKINPNDIKSVSVLKDASSAAIYGARAAFGVILVETKKGESGQTAINFSTQQTLQKAIFPGYEPVSEGGTARQIINDAYQKTLGRALLPEEIINASLAYQELENPTPEDAWMYYEGFLYPMENTYMRDLAMRDFSPQQQYDLSISGAGDKASYYVSLGMVDKKGFYKHGNEKFNRYNALSKINFKINDWLSLEERISFNSIGNNDPHEYHAQWYYQSIAKHFYSPHTFPDLEYYKEPGDRDQYKHLIGMHLDNRNPLPYLKYGGRDISTDNDIWLTQRVTISPIKGLKLNGDFSYRYFWKDYEQVQSKVDVLRGFSGFELVDNIIYEGQSANDWIESGSTKNTYYVINTFAEYTLEKWDDHFIKVLGGFNQEYGNYRGISTRSTQLISPNIPSLSATTGTRTNSDSKNEVMLRGLFYRVNYSFADKYLFEANGRYDGTSRFPEGSRFGFFPSFSAAWRISEEPFMNSAVNWLDNLKLRASYGELGNQSVGSYYPYISTMSPSTSTFLMDGSGVLTNMITPGGLVSNSLTWESVISKNVGLDITVLNQKLDVSFDFFVRDTRDMLMRRSYPGTLGASSPNENAADLKNTGWELSVNWNSGRGKDWFFSVNLALSDYVTEITKYDNPTGAIYDYYIGKEVGEIWGYETVGLFQNESELDGSADQSRLGSNWRLGDVHYADLNGDGVISSGAQTLDDTGDLVRIGNSTPRYSFGINPRIKYKNFSLDVFAQGVLKKDWYPSRGNFIRFFPFKTLSMEQWWIDDSWTPENPNAYFPGRQFAYSDNKNTYNQTRYLQNAAYIRLKNITLSYELPFKFINRAEIYLNGTNLWELTGMYKTLDPEYTTDLQPDYMFHRSYTMGLKVSL
ncbi:SusC/RagA family TonB-linked outer membrane protein [Membranihabitans maritimus]|uniref:SusC/RagA family TonB-linked outer membrane protein n=1 Tax=Membranihabitans maritimus TaxID=2904244 RepID=UPI001F4199B9|nr:TonB-dependent receptor [Membranihabitans maritimus]